MARENCVKVYEIADTPLNFKCDAWKHLGFLMSTDRQKTTCTHCQIRNLMTI